MTDAVAHESSSPRETAYLPGTRWTYPDPLWVYLAGLAASVLATIPLALHYGDAPIPNGDIITILAPAQFVGMALVIAGLWRVRDPRPLEQSLGLRVHASDWWAVFVGIALQIGAGIFMLLLKDILPVSNPPEQGITESLQVLQGAGVKLIAFVVVVILAPVVEEVMFRGMLLSRLMRSFGRHAAVAITGVVFALSHVVGDPNAWFAAIALVPLGIGFGYLALSGRGLSRAILAHAGVNLLAAIGLLYLDDLHHLQNQLEDSVGAVLHLVHLIS
jgi:membrane protease YdiL (CAAX protease family)